MGRAILLDLHTVPGAAAGGGAPGFKLPDWADFERESSHTLPEGLRMLDYEIIGPIGEGGFGIVYMAWDQVQEEHVAIKEYLPAVLASRASVSPSVLPKSKRHDADFRLGMRSFIEEAQWLARFDHPALVRVLRFWEAHGTAYMAMPYYDGPTLAQALAERDHAPGERELLDWLGPLLEALGLMHAANCFHRDIAPDNILLTESGPVLLDFGAARRVIGDQQKMPTVVCKPGFTPIEQYGEVAAMKQGAWTDVYALAGVIRTAILGQPPVPSIERLMDDQMRPLAELARGRYSAHFLAAVDAALSVLPRDRPQGANEFWKLLNGDSLTVPDDFDASAWVPAVDVFEEDPPVDPLPAPRARAEAAVLAEPEFDDGFGLDPVAPEPRAAAQPVQAPHLPGRALRRRSSGRRATLWVCALAAAVLLGGLIAAGYQQLVRAHAAQAPSQGALGVLPASPAPAASTTSAPPDRAVADRIAAASAGARPLPAPAASVAEPPKAAEPVEPAASTDSAATQAVAAAAPTPAVAAAADATRVPPPAPAPATASTPEPSTAPEAPVALQPLAVEAVRKPVARVPAEAPRPARREVRLAAAPPTAAIARNAVAADSVAPPRDQARCTEILQRASLESVTPGEAAFLKRGCK